MSRRTGNNTNKLQWHFPVVEEGDKAGHEGYTFIYTSGTWVAQE